LSSFLLKRSPLSDANVLAVRKLESERACASTLALIPIHFFFLREKL
jgi:hypothetical protein